MVFDLELRDKISEFETDEFEGQVFRAGSGNLDPTAPSMSGGRWAPISDERAQVSVLYTSIERDGALAEIAYHWGQFFPLPTNSIIVHRLQVRLRRVLRITGARLGQLGLKIAALEENLERTQQIGAICEFLDHDGLIVPSLRWPCENLVIFTNNRNILDPLEVTRSEEVRDWRSWAMEFGIIEPD